MPIGEIGAVDALDKHAIKRWRKNVRKARKRGQLARSPSGELDDLKKIVNLYKVYGNDNTALVNPIEQPGVL